MSCLTPNAVRQKKCRKSCGIFRGSGWCQPCFLMNSPIFGQIISRQRRPEKMP